MTDLLLNPGLQPFLAAAVVVLAMLLLEVVLVSLGLSGDASADPEADFDTEFDVAPDGDFDIDLDADFDAEIEADAAADPAFDIDGNTSAPEQGLFGKAAQFFGLGLVPLSIWIALVAAFFACLGLVGQTFLDALTGSMLPAQAAVSLAALPALLLAARAARLVAKLVPRTTTSVISERSYGRRRGIVTVGTASEGNPAQVRFSDQHGNTHHLMAEPLDRAEAIPEGSEVLIMRTRDGQFRLARVT